MKIVTIVGARPQFIKAAAVSRAINESNSNGNQFIEEIIIHTGQHFDKNMSDIFFNDLEIPKPDYNLCINSLSHGAMTGRMMEEIEKILLKEKPSKVLVYGDTNSTIAGALAAKKMLLSVVHVEAGLRSYNMDMPEEVNRILTDRISDILFCPTDTAIKNLSVEGFNEYGCRIIKNGDVMQDAALYYADKAKKPINNLPKSFILATIHRQENTDSFEKLKTIFECLNEISKDIPVVMPIHPRTKNLINDICVENLILIDPVGYLQMVWLLKQCEFVLTDSGGLQKEAFFFKKFCYTLRDQTEWVELVENGFNKLVGITSKEIMDSVKKNTKIIDFNVDLYGNGNASKIIVEELIRS
jgi:UDP-GlcNAc3NAcA epimerase